MDVYKLFSQTAKQQPEKPALVFEGKVTSFSQALEKVNQIGHTLQALGLKQGEKLAIWLPNCPEFIMAYLAAFGLGATVIPIDAMAAKEEVIGILNHGEASILITTFNEAFEIKNYIPSLKHIITNLDELATSDKTPLPRGVRFTTQRGLPAIIDEEDTALIIYTSGTTGQQKGVMLTYRNLDSPIKTFAYFGLKYDCVLCAVPFSHEAGSLHTLFQASMGSTLVIMERFAPGKFLRYIEKYQADLVFAPPAILEALLKTSEIETISLKSLKYVAPFGAPCHPRIFQAFIQKFPHINVITAYGLTESTAPNVVLSPDTPTFKRVKKGILGKPAPWVEIKIVDDKGNELPSGSIGEILLKGWFVMKGYYKEPELTREVLRDGWLYTGDLGYLDEEGYLYITGRKKDVIITGGLSVYANEVEFVISEHPKVKEVAVISTPDKLRGELVKAVIALKEKGTAQEITNHCRKRLASYKIPRVIEFRESLPKTSAGKIKKADLI